MEAHRKAAQAAKNNPVTTVGSLGALIAVAGHIFGWNEGLQNDIMTLWLTSLPVVRIVAAPLIKWWDAHFGDEG